MVSRAVLLLMLLLCALRGGSAWAQPPAATDLEAVGADPAETDPADTDPAETEAAESPEDQARELFEQGIERTEEERWGEALEYFRRSDTLVSRPSTTFNIAVALLRLGRSGEAVDALDAYLRATVNDAVERPRRRQARRMLEHAIEEVHPTAQALYDAMAERLLEA